MIWKNIFDLKILKKNRAFGFKYNFDFDLEDYQFGRGMELGKNDTVFKDSFLVHKWQAKTTELFGTVK